jgi:signal transduction histidine kinase
MQQISATLSRITNQGAFQHRIKLPTGSMETDELASTFNKLFAKIRDLMEGMEQVLGDIAHDMRTPVTRIRGAAESLLSEPDLSGREEEIAGNAIEECDRILGLVNTILEINAAESQLKATIRKPVDLVALIREGADLFAFMIEDKGIDLAMTLPGEAPVLGDLGHLQRVISNLLDNAIKYTPKGGHIKVAIEARNGHFLLTFDDTGVGVPEGESELIFQRFYRSDKSRTLPGNGLGLTFSKAVITAMGGSIRHRGKTGPGSIFEVNLPAAPGETR